MIQQVVVGIAASNPDLSAYQLRKVLLGDQSGFMLLMTYMYNISMDTTLLEGNPIVASIEQSIPRPVKAMIVSLKGAAPATAASAPATAASERTENKESCSRTTHTNAPFLLSLRSSPLPHPTT